MKYILTFINTIIFFFVTDLILSNFIKDTKITTIEKNDSYDYSFVPNLNTKDRYGHLTFNLCTDYNSFRINCSDKNKKIKNKKNFDLIVIGDSFVEGIGLDHKDTFIGKLQISYPNLVIGNAGVRGYSTKNYLNKIKFLIKKLKVKT